jgi:glycosyltransferase involved in cell wall biosynthesis
MNSNGTLVFVANTAWSMYNFRKGLLERLTKEGHKVAVIAPYDEFSSKLEDLGVKFYALTTIQNKGKNPFRDILFINELKYLYKKINPSLIFHYTIKPNIYGTIAASHLKIPSIAITTGLGYAFTHKNAISIIVTNLYRFALKKSKEVWFLNKEDESAFLKNNIIRKNQSFVLNGEGIDTSLFCALPKNFPVPDKKRRFILIARLLYDKGVEEFAKASAILHKRGYQFECQVLGFLDVKNPKAISRKQIYLWQQQGLITYLGVTTDVKPFIEAADCMVLPSYYGEGIPRTLMEAASLSKPVITTNNVGCKEVVEDGLTGLLCKVKDAEDLAAKMEAILNLPESELVKMGKAGRAKMVAEFEESLVIGKYIQTITKYITI